MLNHVPTGGEGRMVGVKQFIIASTRSYEPGEQVYDSYGVKTNFDLLSGFGFVPYEDNPNNGAKLEVSLNIENNPVHKLADEILKVKE